MVFDEDGSDRYSDEDAADEVGCLEATVKRGGEQERGENKCREAMLDPRLYSLLSSGDRPALLAQGHWVRGNSALRRADRAYCALL